MRTSLAAVVLTVVALVPTKGNAQAFSLPTPAPQVTAASADWQIRGEPVFYAGNFYYPTGPSVYFDGNVMVRTGVYRGVPLYVDATVDPYSVVYVPIGGRVVRPYERVRGGDLTGTVGNRPPSFPIERDVELSAASGSGSILTPPTGVTIEPDVMPERVVMLERERAVATYGASVPSASSAGETLPMTPTLRAPMEIQSIPKPQSNLGIWLEYEGTRYYSAGASVPYSRDRFTRIGEQHGFPVYRDANGPAGEIYVAIVKDGPIAPFKR